LSVTMARNITRRILVINPNTNETVSELIRHSASPVIALGTAIDVVNPSEGPYGVQSQEDREAAKPNVLSLIRNGEKNGYDGFVLACFDDIGLEESRQLVAKPVVGSVEAGIAITRTLAQRFAIVTTFSTAVPTINELLKVYGVEDICSVHAAGISVAAAAQSTSDDDIKVNGAIKKAIDDEGAGAILLGSAGLSGKAADLSKRFSLPVVDCVVAAIKLAECALIAKSPTL